MWRTTRSIYTKRPLLAVLNGVFFGRNRVSLGPIGLKGLSCPIDVTATMKPPLKGIPSHGVASSPFSNFRASVSTAVEAIVSEDEISSHVVSINKDFRQIIDGSEGNGVIIDSSDGNGVLVRENGETESVGEKAPRGNNETERTKERNRERALRARQLKIETEAWEKAAKEYQELAAEICSLNLAPSLPYMKSLFLGWFEPLRDAIAAQQKMQKSKKYKTTAGQYLLELPADMLAVITMHKTVTMLLSRHTEECSVRVVNAVCELGHAVEQEAKIHKFLLKTRAMQKKSKEERAEGLSKDQETLRKRIENLLKKQKGREVRMLIKANKDSKPWGTEMQAKVGSLLLELLLQTAFIQPPADQNMDGPPDIRPAFKHTFKTTVGEKSGKKTRRYGVIECDPLLRKGIGENARHMVIPYMPMLVRPVPWTRYNKGGYLFLPSYVMRIHGARQQREALKRAPPKQLGRVYQVLNILGSTKWRINNRVLDVVDKIWSEGGGIADLVDRRDIPLPEKPETEDEKELRKWRWRMRKTKKENSEMHSQRCDVELKLSVARKMKDESYFYYPHNIDFRGRAYPMHPYLNHLGSDMCRGVLEFAEGRPLGKNGLSWLKIHAANLFGGGVDKLSFESRMAFIEDNMNDIIDSAEKPLNGRRFWLQAEDPFQFLATSMNIADALKCSNPESFVCYTPVHQDGSCNGLQHYAALGRDRLGAEAVNLTCGDKPADVYSEIAARVDQIMRMDASKDISTSKHAHWARMLLGQVDRKLVKQTVMTSVYGVTFVGAREQLKKRLKERGIFSDETDLYNASLYAARVTLAALGEMFKAARSIMSWLGDCAKVIAAENQTVRWTTPLGLPVVQPYHKRSKKIIKTSLQFMALQEESNQVMVQRQRTAFPPNFVHSLDSSHMMMTALACNKAGLIFAGVHDSYWTHASDVDTMNRILREKFVELYKQPILEDLLESFQKSFPNMVFPPLPERGDFVLEEVSNSPYFFN
eukprot:TRINITY_DN6880_c0_g2_i1.p1 TRINITY_DN6880_c0_g2~~TRINITY_DN6880_c0_g2_i1.p1  ORF type:complete len:988 (-),score=209.84 TRINITY_DN6880_c0_g2_i1:846-3809(-)